MGLLICWYQSVPSTIQTQARIRGKGKKSPQGVEGLVRLGVKTSEVVTGCFEAYPKQHNDDTGQRLRDTNSPFCRLPVAISAPGSVVRKPDDDDQPLFVRIVHAVRMYIFFTVLTDILNLSAISF